MARVLITGCSTGIGRATAAILAQRGHTVVASARNPATLQDLEVADRIALDVTDPASVAAAVERAGAIDVLVNNAGISLWGPIEANGMDDVERVIATNLTGAIRMTKAVLPQMRARRSGLVVQISSAAARRPQPAVGIYSASKIALEAASLALRMEMQPFNVRIAVVGMAAVESGVDQNRTISETKGTEYDAMMRAIRQRVGKVRHAALETIEAARVIVSVVEAENPPFRSYVGEGLAEALAETARLSDAEYERRFALA